jgi:hypothetical protein
MEFSSNLSIRALRALGKTNFPRVAPMVPVTAYGVNRAHMVWQKWYNMKSKNNGDI